MGRTKKIIKVGKISGKDDILTVEEKRISLIGHKKKISLEITPEKIGSEARRLKASKMRIKKLIEFVFQILVETYAEGSYR